MIKRFPFTYARLEKLVCPPDGDKHARLYVWDEKQPGLALCVTSNGVKVFYVVKKVNGRVERIRLAAFPDINVDEARKLAQETIGKIAGGTNPAEDRRIARGEQTLGDVFKRFIEDWGKPQKRTWEDDVEQFERHCTSLASRRLSDIKLKDIQRLHAGIGKVAPYAANRVLALLSSVFNFALTIGYEGGNPCKGIKRFREESRVRFLQPDEIPRFHQSLDDHPDQMIADFFRLALLTGARRSNVQAAAWSDVNLARRCWTIPASASKSKEPIELHLTDDALDVLRRRWEHRIEGNPFVFPSYGRTGHITEPKAAWREILNRAEITDLRLHDLRRTHGSWLTAAGAPAAVVAKALGQTTQHVTHVYTRVNLATVASAVDLAAKAMAGTVKAKPSKRQKATA